MKILVVAPQWIGDCVMAQPMLALLRAQHPKAAITALAMPQIAPVLRSIKEINHVIEAPFVHGSTQWRLRFALARQLRAERFDCAYVLPNSLKSALVPFFARIPKRIGYLGEQRYGLLNQRLPNPAKEQRPLMTQFYAALVDAPSGTAPPEPALFRPVADVTSRFDETKFIALCPGAEFGPAKQWPATHFQAIAIAATQAEFAVLVMGGPRDAAIGDEIVDGVVGASNMCGKTTLDDAIAMLGMARGVVSNDSGLMHVAAALKRPTVGVYGSTDPLHTPPAKHRSATIWLGPEKGVACSPCFSRECRFGHTRCLSEISPAKVWQQLNALMTPARRPDDF